MLLVTVLPNKFELGEQEFLVFKSVNKSRQEDYFTV